MGLPSRVSLTSIAGLVVGVLMVAPNGLAASSGTPRADRPGLSGSVEYGGNTVTWSVGGVSPVPSDRADLAAAYDGIVKGGAAVTFSGTMSFVIAGGVTNLSQQASLSGGSTTPTAGFSQRVTEGTYTTPFAFSVNAPWVKGVTPQPNGVAATMVAFVESKNCNDTGMCGGPSVSLTLAVMSSSGGAKPSTGNEPPVITVLAHAASVPVGRRIPAAWRLKDDSGRAKWFAGLYSGGALVATAKSPTYVKADGRVDTAQWPRDGGGDGPFYYCFYAQDTAGNVSANAPMSSCQWVSVEVPIADVSNGCGAATWGPQVADLLNWAGDVRMYGSNKVDIRPACNQHDAGYAGATVARIDSRKTIDYRTWTREQVDQKFYEDIMGQCRKALKGPANADYLRQCRDDAFTYVGLVRKFGQGAFDANSTLPDVQANMPASTVPTGGARNNT